MDHILLSVRPPEGERLLGAARVRQRAEIQRAYRRFHARAGSSSPDEPSNGGLASRCLPRKIRVAMARARSWGAASGASSPKFGSNSSINPAYQRGGANV